MANINIDHLLLNILMWESGQKICFLCVLLLGVVELVVLPILAGIYITCMPKGEGLVLYMCTYTNMHRVVERVALLMYILYVCIYVYQVYVVSILH